MLPTAPILDHMRFWLRDAAGATDAALLARFVAGRDPDAFAALVDRHGPLVWGVCRRVLGDRHAAEDAFQATFLVLVRNPRAVRRPAALAAWLHGVAYRLAVRAARRERRRQAATAPPSPRFHPDPLDELSARELVAILDAEIERLPEADRGPLILCCLYGLSLDEAAARLGVSAGAVRGRLERSRSRLRRNLAKRGVTVPMALGTGLLLASPAVARSLIEATVSVCLGRAAVPGPAAALLAAGPRPRLWAALAIGIVGIGIGLIPVARSPAPEPPAAKAPTPPPRVDNHGDPLPDGAVARFGTLQFRRRTGFVVVRPDGKTVVDVDQSLLVRTLDAATGRLLGTKQLPADGVEGVSAITRSGRAVLAKLSMRQEYHVIDLESGKQLGKLEATHPYPYRLAMSAGGTLVAIGTTEDRNSAAHLRLWDVATGAVREIGQHVGSVSDVRFSPDEKFILSIDRGGLHAWNIPDGAARWTIKDQFNEFELDFSPNGKSVLARRGFQPGEWVRLDAATGKPIAGDTWPVRSGQEAASFCPDGQLLLQKYPQGVRAWDTKIGKESFAIPESGGKLAFFPDGKSFIGAYPGGGMLQRWDLTTGKPLWPDTRDLGHTAQLIRLAFDPTGRRLATSAHDNTVRIWDAVTRAPLAIFPVPRPAAWTMVFSRDGRSLFASTQEEWIQWDVTAGKEVRRVSTKPTALGQDMYSFLVSARLSADEHELIGTLYTEDGSGMTRTGSVVVWDLESGKERIRRDNALRDRGVALAPDGTWFVQTTGKIHDARTGRERRPLQVPPGLNAGPFWSKPAIAFSRDGRFAASGVTHTIEMNGRYETHYDGVQVWETATGRPLARLDTGQVSCLAFSPDGRTVATSDMDGLRGWDAATGGLVWSRSVGKLPRSMYTFSFTPWIEYSPDGKTIATALPDTTALLWAITPRLPRPAALATPAEKDATWAALLSPNAPKGVAAAWALADTGAPAVALIGERIKPVSPIPADQIQKWIAALGDAAFAKREAATKELAAMGERADPALRAALAGNPSAEARQRIEKLLAAPLDVPPPETVRFLRAVQALEAIGSAEARELLRKLSQGDAAAAETKAASAALARLGK